MRAYLIKRVFLMIPTLLGITLVVYAVLLTLPGDPVDVLLAEHYGARMAKKLRAESWTEGDHGLTYEFTLRQGLTFHNGDPFTAEDVKFSFQRYKGGGAKTLRDKVHAVEIVDAHRIRFRLNEPWPDFMTFYGTTATAAA